MAVLEFKDLSFEDNKDRIKVNFLKIFYFYLEKIELEKIGKFKTYKNKIIFKDTTDTKASRKFNFLLEIGFQDLKNKVTGRKTIYIHKNSGIPLLGTIYFGIIDRGTNIIEIRPITGCNINCIYCSVDEGCPSKKLIDDVIEKDYLVEELRRLIDYKKADNIDIHINSQGEPLLYADIVELVRDIKNIKAVKIISIDTNGTLLNKNLINSLADAGLTRFNLSLNAINPDIADKIANKPYDIKKVLEMAKYITKKTDLIITPVLVKGYNEQEMPRLIEFAKEVKAGKNCPPIGIQNFLNYRFGRNPVKEIPMEEFFKILEKLEKEHDIELTVKQGFKIEKTKELSKPFKRKEIIEANIRMPGRIKKEKLAISKERIITVPNCYKDGKAKIRITRTKHNIFYGELV